MITTVTNTRTEEKSKRVSIKKLRNNCWHSFHGLVQIAITAMLKISCRVTSAFVEDMRSRRTILWHCLIRAQNIAIERSMRLAHMVDVKCYVILEAVLLVPSTCQLLAIAAKSSKECLVNWLQEPNLLAKTNVENCSTAFPMSVSEAAMKDHVTHARSWSLKHAIVEKRRDKLHVEAGDSHVRKYVDESSIVKSINAKNDAMKDSVLHAQELQKE